MEGKEIVISKESQIRLGNLQSAYIALERAISENCVDGIRKENALSRLEEAFMWGTMAIAYDNMKDGGVVQ